MVYEFMARRTMVWFTMGAAIVLALVVAPGCRRAADPPTAAAPNGHDRDDGHVHDDQIVAPRDYLQAVSQIQAHSQRIAKAIASSDPEAAHGPLDVVDGIIGQLMPLAKSSGVPRADWERVNVARRELRAEFDKLHATLDAGGIPDYAAVRGTIEDYLRRLQTAADQLDDKSPSQPVPADASPSKEVTP